MAAVIIKYTVGDSWPLYYLSEGKSRQRRKWLTEAEVALYQARGAELEEVRADRVPQR